MELHLDLFDLVQVGLSLRLVVFRGDLGRGAAGRGERHEKGCQNAEDEQRAQEPPNLHFRHPPSLTVWPIVSAAGGRVQGAKPPNPAAWRHGAVLRCPRSPPICRPRCLLNLHAARPVPVPASASGRWHHSETPGGPTPVEFACWRSRQRRQSSLPSSRLGSAPDPSVDRWEETDEAASRASRPDGGRGLGFGRAGDSRQGADLDDSLGGYPERRPASPPALPRRPAASLGERRSTRQTSYRSS